MSLATLASLVVYGLIAIWYVRPWLNRLGRAEALTVLLWVQVFRYSVLYIFKAQDDGYAISDVAATQLFIFDLTGAAIALAAIILLRQRARLGLLFSWLLIGETIVDVTVGIYQRSVEPPRADPIGVWWLVFNFYAPLVLVTLMLLTWQLYVRSNEKLTHEGNTITDGVRAQVDGSAPFAPDVN